MRKDIILNEDFDLLVEGGDFAVSESDEQHVQLIATSNKGDWREEPTLGLNPAKFVNAVGAASKLKRALQLELRKDGYGDLAIEMDGLQVNIQN